MCWQYGIEKFYCQKCPENNIVLRFTHLAANTIQNSWPQPFVAWRYMHKKLSIPVNSEQGLGDRKQYCRHVKSLYTKARKILLEVEKTACNTCAVILPPNRIFIRGDKLLEFDFQCPLMSLPLAFNKAITSVPFAKPYLHVLSARIDWWKEYLSEL